MNLLKDTSNLPGDKSAEPRLLVIEPPQGWRALDIGEIWRYRELLWVLVERDIKIRYKQTFMGFAWAIIQPFMMMVVFSIFFGKLANMPAENLPYPIFVYTGLLPWTFFANSIGQCANSLVNSSSLVNKVYFPRLIIPLSSVGSGLVDLLIATGVLLLMMLFYNIGWTANLLFAPILLIGTLFIALGCGILLSALTVTYRDFKYVVPFALQFWMFATPVVYPATLVPQGWRWLMFLNPMAGIIEGFRSAFLGRPFDIPSVAISFVVAAAIFAVGVAYFEKVERGFADVI